MSKPKFTPGPWSVGYRAMHVDCENAKIGGTSKLFDVRGWGYLTGTGHGGLGLPAEEAYEIQKANAALAAAAPDLFEALQWMVDNDDTYESDEPMPSSGGLSWNEYNAYWIEGRKKAERALAKAKGEKLTEGGEHVG